MIYIKLMKANRVKEAALRGQRETVCRYSHDRAWGGGGQAVSGRR